ncbi:MAG TPA: hypothetical protein VM285_11690, partial [Polyangia bacterium]|nr:hypothetical protein [Polyangia bacterium]
SSNWQWNLGRTGEAIWQLQLGPAQGEPHSFRARGGGVTMFMDLPQLGPVVIVNNPEWTPPW